MASYTSLDIFLCNYSYETGRDIGLELSKEYCFKRTNDYYKLRKELKWTLHTEGVMCTEIYGIKISLAFKDSALHSNQKAGGGDMWLKGEDDPECFKDLDQVLAYILATRW
jgi:hypothetical protein